MAKNNLIDLRNHLFAQLERLGDDENMADLEKLETELSRAKSIADISQVIVNSARLEVDMMKYIGEVPINKQKNEFLGITGPTS